ncbi:hypothetical protein ACFL1O_00410 [Patescibacteria group bacterium]
MLEFFRIDFLKKGVFMQYIRYILRTILESLKRAFQDTWHMWKYREDVEIVVCKKCENELITEPAVSKLCPECGKRYIGYTNKRCSKCAKRINKCPFCDAPLR